MVFLQITCLFCCCFQIWTKAAGFSPDFGTFEITDFEIIEVRSKRSSSASKTTGHDLEMAFTSFDTKFHLLLHRDPTYQKFAREVRTSGESSEEVRFYEGVLDDQSSPSAVSCYLSGGQPSAWIVKGNESFFVEPASDVLDDSSLDPSKIAVFKNGTQFDWTVTARFPDVALDVYNSSNVTAEASGFNVTSGGGEAFCRVELVADKSLYDYYGRNAYRTHAVMLLHAKFADHVFRSTDFGLRGRPDAVRITVAEMTVYESRSDRNYPMSSAGDLSNYLTRFSFRKQASPFCLSVALLYRRFRGTAVGEAYRPDPRYEKVMGGICERPLYVSGRGMLHLNTGVLNLQYQSGRRLPLSVTLPAFTHEVAHGFGSDHDPRNGGSEVCSPRDNPFLMYPTTSGSSENAFRLSPCSRKNIRDMLQLKGSCLGPAKAVCGNGIKEENEECDCGPAATCQLLDPCCTPSCTLKSRCSPREHECCKDCSTPESAGFVCYRDDYLCSIGMCDGRNHTCPEPKTFPKAFCRPKPLLCLDNDTTCGNVCEPRGLLDCVCKRNQTFECLRCCLSQGECLPAADLGLNTTGGLPFVLPAGSSCKSGRRRCDGEGNCEDDIRRYKASDTLYMVLTALCLAVSGMLIFAIFVGCRLTVRRRVPQEEGASAQPLTTTS